MGLMTGQNDGYWPSLFKHPEAHVEGTPDQSFCPSSENRGTFNFWTDRTRNEAEKHAKGFSCWGPLVSMMFCQMETAHSLGEISHGLKTAVGTQSSGTSVGLCQIRASLCQFRQALAGVSGSVQSPFGRVSKESRYAQTKFHFKSPIYNLNATTRLIFVFRYITGRSFAESKGLSNFIFS